MLNVSIYVLRSYLFVLFFSPWILTMTVEPTFNVTINNSDQSVIKRTFVAQDSSRLYGVVRRFG